MEIGELIASITGLPASVCVESTKVKMCVVNLTCVKKEGKKKIEALLSAEMTRRANL